MALTITEKKRFTLGGRFGVTAKVNIGTYASNGLELLPATLGLKSFYKVEVEPYGGYTFTFDYTNNKVLAYRLVPAATAVFTNSGSTATFTNSGSTSTFTNSGSTFTGAANQTLTTTDLTGATTSLLVVSGTVFGISGTAASGIGSGKISAPAGTVTAAGTIATTAAGTIASTAAGTIAVTGTAGPMTEVGNSVSLAAVDTRLFAQGI